MSAYKSEGGPRYVARSVARSLEFDTHASSGGLCPTVAVLRAALGNIKALVSQKATARNQLRELGILVGAVGDREARVQRVRRMRLTLGKQFFEKMEEDPRLTNSNRSWERPEREEPDSVEKLSFIDLKPTKNA